MIILLGEKKSTPFFEIEGTKIQAHSAQYYLRIGRYMCYFT